MARVSICVLGSPHITVDGAVVNFRRHKSLILTAYLAVNESGAERSRICDLFWPDHDETRGRANLRIILSECRKLISQDLILTGNEMIRLNPDVVDHCDLRVFRSLVNKSRIDCDHRLDVLTKASELYRGEFLQGLHPVSTPELDDWIYETGRKIEAELIDILEKIVEETETTANPKLRIQALEMLVHKDPMQEEYHRTLMAALAESGDRVSALNQYKVLKRILEREFGTEPENETTRLAQEISGKPKKRIGPAGTEKQLKHHSDRKRVLKRRLALITLGSILILSLFLLAVNRMSPALQSRTIAVLPFKYLCSEEGVERFAENFTMELITALTKETSLSVTPHRSVINYLNTTSTLQEIAGELHVDCILDGSAMRVQDRIRYSMQLIDIRKDECIWAETYEYIIENPLSTHDDAITDIVSEVNKKFNR